MKTTTIFLALSILIVTASSIFFSKPLYMFYLKTYYITIKKMNYETLLNKTKTAYNEKNIRQFQKNLEIGLLLFPEKWEINRLATNYYFSQNNIDKGLETLLLSLQKNQDDFPFLRNALYQLFMEKKYMAIVEICRNYPMLHDTEIAFYYGVSLYHWGDIQKSQHYLDYAFSHGYNKTLLLYYLGLVNGELHNTRKAVLYLKKALEQEPYNEAIRTSLVKVYHKAGDFKSAEKIMRGTMK